MERNMDKAEERREDLAAKVMRPHRHSPRTANLGQRIGNGTAR
jgi:hypothetical protein